MSAEADVRLWKVTSESGTNALPLLEDGRWAHVKREIDIHENLAPGHWRRRY